MEAEKTEKQAAQSHANTTLMKTIALYRSVSQDKSKQVQYALMNRRLWSGDDVYVERPYKNNSWGMVCHYIRKKSYQLYKNRVEMSADLAKTATLPNKAICSARRTTQMKGR